VGPQVGPFTKYSNPNSKNEPDQPFPYSILSHFPIILQIYKPSIELHHHALFRFTHFAVKNYDSCNFTVGHSPLLIISCKPILKPVGPLFILGHSLLALPHLRHLRTHNTHTHTHIYIYIYIYMSCF
jgi:hypothetical protein